MHSKPTRHFQERKSKRRKPSCRDGLLQLMRQAERKHNMTEAAINMLNEVLSSEDAEEATSEMLNIVQWFINRSDEEKRKTVEELAECYRREVMTA